MEGKLSVEEKYPDVTIQEHVKSKDMWAGSLLPAEYTEYVVTPDGIAIDKLTYAPALYKCFDEAIVNAEDHAVNCRGQVTYIDIRLDAETGEFAITNDGPGVEVEYHSTAKMYVPQFIFGIMFKGSNLKKSPNSITGGTNGVGVKLSNIMSKKFSVETVDNRPSRPTHKYYRQEWRDGMSVVDAPVIVDLAEEYDRVQYPASKTAPHTTVAFLPDYRETFKYPESMSIRDITAILNKVLAMRAIKASSYIGWATGGKCRVYYNGKRIDVTSMRDMARALYPGETALHANLSCGDARFPWEVVIVKLSDKNAGGKYYHMSNVNGVAVKAGKHIDVLNDQITDHVKESMIKELGKANLRFNQQYIYNNLFVLVNAQIPGAQWTGQRKDELDIDKRQINKYQLDKKTLDAIAEHINKHVLGQIYVNIEKSGVKKGKMRYIDKYTPALYSKDPKTAHLAALLLPEGDSAATMVREGITYKPRGADKPLLGFERYGILTLGGVIMNARKATKESAVGEDMYTMTEKLAKNKFFNALKDAVGFNTTYKYDKNSPTYRKEMRELHYGLGVIAAVDQDHDGIGFIFSLLISLFERFWPNLLSAGFVKRFATPIKRALPNRGGKVHEFYSELEFVSWCRDNDAKQYDVKYIKGLGTHTKDQIHHLFMNFEKNLYTYYPTAETRAIYDMYFGNDPEARKRLLRIPIKPLSDETIMRQRAEMRICCDDHAEQEAKAHDLSNLVQKLYHVIDGMNESGRKILHGSISKFAKSNKEIRVAQLGGYISEHEKYHHGEVSLYDNITGKAFITVGGVQLPQLIPCGQFGTRSKAVSDKKDGKVQKAKSDSAQPRYIETKLNKRLVDLLYPKADQYILKYVESEGKQVEPEYFVPIIPMAIIESTEIPAHGWKIKVWAREVKDVIRNVRILINNPDTKKLIPMKPYTLGHKGATKYVRGSVYSFGRYEYDPNTETINITELPLRVWTEPYCAYIREKKKLVERVENYSSDAEINIQVKLTPGAMTEIEQLADAYCDGVEQYLELRVHMDSHLNMIAVNGSVSEFSAYEEVVLAWFPERKRLYELRIERQRVILQIKLRYLKNIKRYVGEYDNLKISRVEDSHAEQILTSRNYDRFNKAVVETPKYIATAELEFRSREHEDCTYDYLLNTTDRQKLAVAVRGRDEEIAKLEYELQELIAKASKGIFPGSELWTEELDRLERVIEEGRQSDWKFGDKDKFIYE